MSPGDVVVCISRDAPCGCGERIGSDDIPTPIVGRHYRIDGVEDGQCTGCGLVIPCLTPVGNILPDEYSWPQECFAREEPGVDIFTLAERTPVNA